MEDIFKDLIVGVDWVYAFYHGEEVANREEGMVLAIERSPSEAKRVAFGRVLRYARGGEVSFRVASGEGESGEAVQQEKALVDDLFAELDKNGRKTFLDLGKKS